MLADKDIKKYIKDKRIKIYPEPNFDKSLGSCSIDLRLGEIAGSHAVMPFMASKIKDAIESHHYKLRPKKFALATTLEYIELPNDLCGMLHGRSSLGRKGLMVHSTAALIDAGFKGKIVLELFNAGSGPIELEIGSRICAMSFEKLSSPAQVPYYKKHRAKYLGQEKPIK
jgi:dCTP deaminase